MTSIANAFARPARVRNGDPTPLQRLKRRSTILSGDDCWIWNGCVNSRGYGCIAANGTVVLVHRLSYFLHNGHDVPDDRQIDHRCHNADRDCKGGNTCLHRRCWRPDHLEVVTAKENQRRRIQGNDVPPPRRPDPQWQLILDDFFGTEQSA